MNPFFILTLLFSIVSFVMIIVILVQRPQGGGLAGAFGGAGGGGADSVFGGRVGDALTWATVSAFVVYLILAIVITQVPIGGSGASNNNPVVEASPGAPATTEDAGMGAADAGDAGMGAADDVDAGVDAADAGAGETPADGDGS